MPRKDALVANEVYHVFTKSIAGFVVFNDDEDFMRIKDAVRYYQVKDLTSDFSSFLRRDKNEEGFKQSFLLEHSKKDKLANIVSYCIMPTHIHLILKQKFDNGISTFMGNVLNSYSRYFNLRHKRKGPLWEGKFKNVLVKTDEQLLHLSRYIHLNPTSAGIINSPEKWRHSSYHEYLGNVAHNEKICYYDDCLTIPNDYKGFVEDRAAYQRELAMIKHLILE